MKRESHHRQAFEMKQKNWGNDSNAVNPLRSKEKYKVRTHVDIKTLIETNKLSGTLCEH